MAELSFDEWKRLVDDEVRNLTGLSCDDLPDVDYMEMYDDMVEPEEAAEMVLEYAEEGN